MEAKPTKPKSRTGLWVAVVLLGLGLLISVAINTGLAAALLVKSGKGLAHDGGGEDEFPVLTERWSYGSGDVKAVRIPILGVIAREGDDGWLGSQENKIDLILHEIQAAKNDEDVKAIILEVDSPGGGITPSDEIYNALLDFRDSDDSRRIVVFMRDLAASGGYYVSMAGDWLIAEPTTVVGSIGVIMQSLNWKQLSEKVGIRDVTIKSGANKDLLNPFVDAPPEQLAMLQGMIDAMYNHFLGIVQDARPIEADKLKALADGRIFAAEEALDLQLIDQIGYWDDAVERTAELLNEKTIKVVRYEHRPTLFDFLSGIRMPLKFSNLLDAQTPRFQYLWKP
ncbi:MAG: signal peptide peptidase SppA [bacterium]